MSSSFLFGDWFLSTDRKYTYTYVSFYIHVAAYCLPLKYLSFLFSKIFFFVFQRQMVIFPLRQRALKLLLSVFNVYDLWRVI